MLSNATDKFESPLVGDQCISLYPGKNDFQLLKDNLTRFSQKYGYQYLLTDVATTRTVMPGIAPNPDIITCSNPIKTMDVYDDKLLELAQKHASLTWGNKAFTNQSSKVISNLTAAGRHFTTAGCLTLGSFVDVLHHSGWCAASFFVFKIKIIIIIKISLRQSHNYFIPASIFIGRKCVVTLMSQRVKNQKGFLFSS